MASYYVTREERCNKCDGTGLIRAPIWEKFWVWYYENSEIDPPTRKEVNEWWQDQGYKESAPYPEEKITCPDCNGIGTIDSQVLLDTALRDLVEELNILVGHDSK